MSNDGDISLGGKDWYISLSGILEHNQIESDIHELEMDLDEVGDILLFSGKTTSARILNEKGISPSEWRWAIHGAETALQNYQDWNDLEAYVVKDLLNLGRRYAIARYAKWEGITYFSAMTAAFPNGFRALLDQFMGAEPLFTSVAQRQKVQSSVLTANAAIDLTAYRRVAIIQLAIHNAAIEGNGPSGHLRLDKKQMRNILSLARLCYSVNETNVQSFNKLNDLESLYENERLFAQRNSKSKFPGSTQKIRNWELRHLHALIYLYPYSIRNAICRAREHCSVQSDYPCRITAVNELALARCQILLMRNLCKKSQTI